MRLACRVRELQTGLWHWEAPHPDWTPVDNEEGWGPEVTSYAIDDGERLLLIDPLAAPREIDELAAGRETAIVLTCAWHDRDARSLAERLDAAVFVPQPEEGDPIEGRQLFSAGDRLPVGVQAFPGKEENDLVLWIDSRRALAVGDTLVDRGEGLELPADWLRKDLTREQVLEVLRPLLEQPVELVLATHGGPTDRAALERALS
jgi:glyoxylase-like metal-dependent hydrolase (beta-lactamase superfamily II)